MFLSPSASTRPTSCGFLLLSFAAMLVLGTPHVRAETPLSEEELVCLNKKAKASAGMSKQVLDAHARNEKTPDPARLAVALAKAEEKLVNAFSKAEEKVCRTIGDAAAIAGEILAHAAEIAKNKLKGLNSVRSPRRVDTTLATLPVVKPRVIIDRNPATGTSLLFYPPDARVPEVLVRCAAATGVPHRHASIEHVDLNNNVNPAGNGACPNPCPAGGPDQAPIEIHVPFCSVAGPQELVDAKVVVGWVTCRNNNANPGALAIPNDLVETTFEYRGSATGASAGKHNIYWFLIGGCASESKHLINAMMPVHITAPLEANALAPLHWTFAP